MENKSLYEKLTEKTNVCSKKEKEWMTRAKEFDETKKERDRLLKLKNEVIMITKERDKALDDVDQFVQATEDNLQEIRTLKWKLDHKVRCRTCSSRNCSQKRERK